MDWGLWKAAAASGSLPLPLPCCGFSIMGTSSAKEELEPVEERGDCTAIVRSRRIGGGCAFWGEASLRVGVVDGRRREGGGQDGTSQEEGVLNGDGNRFARVE